MSPIERTLKLLRERGLWAIPCKDFPIFVERSIPTRPFPTKVDYGHIIDLIVPHKLGTLGIQVCGEDFAKHNTKITVEYRDNALEWLAEPHRTLELWGWRKLKVKRGGKAMIWTPRIKIYNRDLT